MNGFKIGTTKFYPGMTNQGIADWCNEHGAQLIQVERAEGGYVDVWFSAPDPEALKAASEATTANEFGSPPKGENDAS